MRLWTPFWFLFALGVAVVAFLAMLGAIDAERLRSSDLSIAAGTIILGLITNSLTHASVESVRAAQQPFVVAQESRGRSAALVVRGDRAVALSLTVRNIGRGPAVVLDMSLRDGSGTELIELDDVFVLGVERSVDLELPFGEATDPSALPPNISLRVFCQDIDGAAYVAETRLVRDGSELVDGGFSVRPVRFYDLDQAGT